MQQFLPQERTSGLTSFLIGLLAVLALLYFAWPVWRAQWLLEITLNEPWNAFLVERWKSGFALYPSRDELIANNYPPLSFVLITWLSKFGWSPILIGRVLSLLATATITVCVGAIIRMMGGAWSAAAVGSFWYLATMSRYLDSYVGTNDPNLFALALMMASLTWCIRAQLRGASTVPPFVVMAIAGFYKNSIFAVPLTAFSWLFMQGKGAALRAALIGAAVAAAGLLLCAYIFGGDFMYQLTAPRVMSLRRVISSLGRLQFIAPALLIWIWWAVADRKNPAVKFSVIFMVWSSLSNFLQQSGEGVSDNSQFEMIAALGVGLGLAFGRALPALQMRRNQIAILVIVILRLIVSDRIEPYLLVASPDFRALAQESVEVAKSEAARVRQIPGAVNCSTQTVCIDAGKPFVFDKFWLEQRISLGTLTAQQRDAAITATGIRFEEIDPRASMDVLTRRAAVIRELFKSWGWRS